MIRFYHTDSVLTRKNFPFKRKILSKFASALATIAVTLFGDSATAHPITAIRTIAFSPPAYCEKSKLNSAGFLKLIQTIIDHGDLTDISFLQKILGTKFSHRYGASDNEKSNSNILFFDAQNVLGNPITIHLYIYHQNLLDLKSGAIASIRFDTPSTFITDCFHLSPADISSHLGQEYYGKAFGPGSSYRLYEPQNSSPANDGSKIQLNFFYDFEKKNIYGIIIRQFD